MSQTADPIRKTTCAVVGGGPAGMMLALLLARGGVDVTVMEKHVDFLRDFRGDIVHTSTLNLLDELGLTPAFEAMPHQILREITFEFDEGAVRIGPLAALPGRHKHIALAPQWDFLEMLNRAAETEPNYHLMRRTKASKLLKEGNRVVGVEYVTEDGDTGQLLADLTVGCDGRDSVLRAQTDLPITSFGVPIDVLWFRLPRYRTDVTGQHGRISKGRFLVMFDRGDYYQCGYIIGKGADMQLRAGDVQGMRDQIASLIPWAADRLDALGSWDDAKLLDVQMNRLGKWYQDGLLFIGDAAHAMSPVGGVGVNLAIADAVATARILAEPLREGTVTTEDLRKVQRRRWLIPATIQQAQRFAHLVIFSAMTKAGFDPGKVMRRVLPVVNRFPWLTFIPAYAVAVGPMPEHAPDFARRPAVSTG